MQETLGLFYQRQRENEALKREIDALKMQTEEFGLIPPDLDKQEEFLAKVASFLNAERLPRSLLASTQRKMDIAMYVADMISCIQYFVLDQHKSPALEFSVLKKQVEQIVCDCLLLTDLPRAQENYKVYVQNVQSIDALLDYVENLPRLIQ